MKVDFNNLSLSYKINQIDYGKAFYIKYGEYRAAIGLFALPRRDGSNSCYNLISYQQIY